MFTDQGLAETGVKTMDVAKRLLDFGFHAPTIYFPLVVQGAMMIEPTESESRETLDAFAAAMERIVAEARKDPELLKTAPHTTRVRRLDETRAARKPVLRWRRAEPVASEPAPVAAAPSVVASVVETAAPVIETAPVAEPETALEEAAPVADNAEPVAESAPVAAIEPDAAPLATSEAAAEPTTGSLRGWVLTTEPV